MGTAYIQLCFFRVTGKASVLQAAASRYFCFSFGAQ